MSPTPKNTRQTTPKNTFLAAMCLAVAISLTTSAFAQDDDEYTPVDIKTCGKYKVQISEKDPEKFEKYLKLVYKGKTYVTLKDYSVSAQRCEDITGDGIPEIVLAGFSGGAHCCTTHSVYRLSVPPKLLLEEFSNHSSFLGIKQLDDRGPKEIIGSDWRFAYAYDLGFAGSPVLPVVFSYKNGKYVKSTSRFPNYLQSLVTLPKSKDYENNGKGYALRSYALYIMAKKPKKAQAYLKSLPKEYRLWMKKYLPDINKRLRGVTK